MSPKATNARIVTNADPNPAKTSKELGERGMTGTLATDYLMAVTLW